ncbi:uncharacterized protein ARMOST_19468 [Armillaria ostoyae]|uniref:Uncharacterized protein n=1 Tax=Armillaria ostoyae TaxID=47428 RepID=A0A284S4Q3_ARMOS|nr:uncharacterized protein ARMOST_19468 [Armillaria ostoyae]
MDQRDLNVVPAWCLRGACVVRVAAWLIRVAVRGQPAWCGCVAAWSRGCVVRWRGRLRGRGKSSHKKRTSHHSMIFEYSVQKSTKI